jgi:transcriptional regulator with XRE-family HTH domain
LQRAIIGLRHALNLTQEGLAREMGVTLPAVGHWETDTRPGNIALARLEQLAAAHPDLAAIFHDELQRLKTTQWRKANDVLDEVERWHQIKDHLAALGEEADKLRLVDQDQIAQAKDQIAQAIVKNLVELEKVLAAAQRWSWRNR